MTDTGEVAAAEAQLRDAAIAMVQAGGGVRVEDYLTALAAATGEGALAAAGFDVSGHDLVPGSALFFEPVNELLSGDQGTVANAPPTSVAGILRGVAPGSIDPTELPEPESLYRHVASSVGQAEWGQVTVTVPEANWPRLLPIRAAFELRPVVEALEDEHGLSRTARHQLGATALLAALGQVAGAIDPPIAVRLALEVTFGIAKLAPMTPAAFESLAGET